ncbi:MAG: UDP-2,4-diacetamido-2,4,6-trideoxy-beta-L-altropyranose hydrolase, partial [Pirellulaceae bacterium]|nr:UDP-2,4-diacetamido-2,4,6-trideoxy-beta-L-altropyranose hydrolase [Pirellulaceae bacterium]
MPQIEQRRDAFLAVLRADGSTSIGLGHLIRSLTLLQEFHRRGWRVLLATRCEYPNGIFDIHPIRELLTGTEVIPVSGNGDLTQAELSSATGEATADLLIVDHYELDREFESGFADTVNLRLVIDDLADRPHDCEILVDSAPGRNIDDYQGSVGPDCQILLGGQFSILRPQFAANRARSLARRRSDINKILVAPGATDTSNIAVPILRALSELRRGGYSFAVTVVLSSLAYSCAAVRDILADTPDWELLVDRNDVAEILIETDLAIGTFGSSCWERACLGVPSIAVVAADNQLTIARDFEASGAAFTITMDENIPSRVSELVTELALEPNGMSGMSASAAVLCDGVGCSRIADAVEKLIGEKRLRSDRDTPSLALRPIQVEDCERLFRWQCAPETRRFARNAAPPSWPEHCRWFESRLKDGDSQSMIVEAERTPVGTVRLDPIEDGSAQEISIALAPEHFGKGIALATLRKLTARMPGVALMAYV